MNSSAHPLAPGLVVAVDGTSGSGKSSTSRGVADRLGLRYLDTGAMFRAMTWWLLRNGVDVHDPAAWVGSDTHHVSWLPNVSVELVQVAVFLSAFSGLYFTVVVVTDETYREQFFTGVMQELDRALGVRAAYLTLQQE